MGQLYVAELTTKWVTFMLLLTPHPRDFGVRQIQCYSGSSVAGFGEPEVREQIDISTMIDTLATAPELITEEWLNTHTPISLQELRGKVVVIEAFQMLCPGCVLYGIPQAVRISCLLYTSPSPRDRQKSRMPSSA